MLQVKTLRTAELGEQCSLLDQATWVVPYPYDWTDTSWFLLLLALLVVMGSVALRRTQRDAEGLI